MKTTTAIVVVAIAAVLLAYSMTKRDAHVEPVRPPADSGVSGTVITGPTCPVMQEPPDPLCRDHPYQTTVDVWKYGTDIGRAIVASAETDAEGTFRIELKPGFYVISPRGGAVLPRCDAKNIEIQPHAFQTVNLFCDTGIR